MGKLHSQPARLRQFKPIQCLPFIFTRRNSPSGKQPLGNIFYLFLFYSIIFIRTGNIPGSDPDSTTFSIVVDLIPPFSIVVNLIPPFFHGSSVLCSSKDKAELLAKSFSSNCSLPEFLPRSNETLCNFHITPSDVANVISKLDSSTASGPDNISGTVLKHISPELSSILFKLFNKCLIESCFPPCWKRASVFPVSGDRSDPLNYLPISLLPIISTLWIFD